MNSVPPFGFANQPARVGDGAGEGAATIAEQLPLEHLARHGGDIQRDERLVGLLGERMDFRRNDFFACTCFPGDEDGEICPRNLADLGE